MIGKQNQKYLPVTVGCLSIDKRARELIIQVLESNRLSIGPMVKTFERLFAEKHNVKYATMVSSGTCALQIALSALKEVYDFKDFDEVLVPAITFIATSNIVIYNNMKPVFVDVDPLTYNINPYEIEKYITKKTRAIIAVHLFGLPADMDPILEIANKYNLRIIEDSCETMFAKYNNKYVGSFGDYGCFSTYVAHILVTGVGGLITSNSEDLEVLAKSLLNHGRDSIYLNIDDDNNIDDNTLKNIIERRFSFVRLGYSYRPTELEGALGIAQIERADEFIKKRKNNALFLIKHLSDYEDFIQLPSIPENRDHSFMMFPIVIKQIAPFSRSELINFLEKRGIETRFMLPLLTQPVYKKLFGDIESFYPVAKWINNNGFYIGCHQNLNEEHLSWVVESFYDFFKKRKLI